MNWYGYDRDRYGYRPTNNTSQRTLRPSRRFLDLTAKQVMGMREALGVPVRFVLMNSFATSKDTMAFFKAKYMTGVE